MRAVALIVLVGLVLAELTMRAAAAHLPKPLEWPDWETANKVAAIDSLAARGGASVVVLGSSIMNAGVDPALMSRELGDQRPVFNAALNGSNVPSTRLWALNVVVPRLRPKVVVIGIDGIELNGSGKGERRFFNLIRGSAGWRKAVGGASTYESIADHASDWSYLIRYRSVIRKPTSWFSVDTAPLDQRVDVYGTLHPRKRPRVEGAVRKHKFQTFDKDNFSSPVGRNRLALLSDLVERLNTRGIKVVLVRMPTVDEIDVPRDGPGTYAKIETTMKTFVGRHGLYYVDMRDEFTDVSLYSDVHHVNVRGREKLSALLVPFLRSIR